MLNGRFRSDHHAGSLPLRRRCDPPDRSSGFTLIEVLISLAITSILVAAMASSIALATRALPDLSSPAEVIARGGEELGWILEEIEGAVHITDRSANAITFVVPDRDGDALSEVIRYAFSGTPGDPLTRRQNGGPIIDVIESIYGFDLVYDTTSQQWSLPTQVESGSMKFLNVSSGAATGADVGVTNVIVDNNLWYGEYFSPEGFNSNSLPDDAISWSIESVVFRGRQAGNSSLGWAKATLYLATAEKKPDTSSELGQDTVQESWLPWATSSFANVPVGFDSVRGLAPDQGVCFVLGTTVNGPALETKYFAGPLDLPGTAFLESVNGGGSWNVTETTAGMRLSVYGRYVAPGPPLTLTREYVAAVRASLQPTSDPTSRVESSVHTVNLPEVLLEIWETDFSADPTQIDLDANGIPDWEANGGAPFAVSNLRSGGYWFADGELDTNPGYDFADVTTVDLRLQDAQDDGESGGIKLRIDRSGNTYGFIRAEIDWLDDTSQRLTISTYTSGFDFSSVLVEELPHGFFDLRILVDPDRDEFRVAINGQERGAYSYSRISQSNAHVIRMYETAFLTGVQFDHCKIRVGGTIE